MITFYICWYCFVTIVCVAFYNEYLETGNDLYEILASAGILSILFSIVLLLAG